MGANIDFEQRGQATEKSLPQTHVARHITANKSSDLSPTSDAPALQSLRKYFGQVRFIVNRSGPGSVLHDVAVTVRDHHDVARCEAHAVTTIQPHRGAPFSQQVIDDHTLASSPKIARQRV